MPHEVAFADTVAEPSADVMSLGAILAHIALKPEQRVFNVFFHEVYFEHQTRQVHSRMDGTLWSAFFSQALLLVLLLLCRTQRCVYAPFSLLKEGGEV